MERLFPPHLAAGVAGACLILCGSHAFALLMAQRLSAEYKQGGNDCRLRKKCHNGAPLTAVTNVWLREDILPEEVLSKKQHTLFDRAEDEKGGMRG